MGIGRTDGGIQSVYFECNLIGGAAVYRGLGYGASYTVSRLAASGSSSISRLSPTYVQSSLLRHGWFPGSMRARTAARGGWSVTLGRAPAVRARVQWSAAGGRHGDAYWKISGPNIGTRRFRNGVEF